MKHIFILIGMVCMILFVADFVDRHGITISSQVSGEQTLIASNSDGSPDKNLDDRDFLFASSTDGSPDKNMPGDGYLFASSTDGSPDK